MDSFEPQSIIDRFSTIWDKIKRWFNEVLSEKKEYLEDGWKTWEFGLIFLTTVILFGSIFIFPGLFTAKDTTPDSDPYRATITYEHNSTHTTYIQFDCTPTQFITAQEVAYRCDFRFEQSDGSLYTYNRSFVEQHSWKNAFYKNWEVRTSPDTKVRQGAVLSLSNEFVHPSANNGFGIYGTFAVIAPEDSDIYSFSIQMGNSFGGMSGHSQRVTVFSPSEASTLETRETLMPFQRLVLVGILLSVLKLWIDLFDRIGEKIQE